MKDLYIDGKKRCPGCKEYKKIEEFRGEGKTIYSRCITCAKEQRQNYKQTKRVCQKKIAKKLTRENQEIILSYLSTHPCCDCGESDIIVLQFDHVKGKKIGDISKMRKRYNSIHIITEIQKCEVVCANCHIKRSEKRNPGYRTKYTELSKEKP